MLKFVPSLPLILGVAIGVGACNKSSPTQPSPPPCTFSVSKTSLSFGGAGGSDSVSVTTAANCNWTAVSDRGWLSITGGATGTGPGAVNVTASANESESPRTGTLTIAGHSVAVSQAGVAPCTFDIAPPGAEHGSSEASGSFTVTAAAHCPWTANSNANWITVTSGGQGSGNGTVSYTVARNTEVAPRSGTITAAGRTFSIWQAGDSSSCQYSVTPVNFDPCMSVPFELTATLTTQNDCTWSSTAVAPWIHVTSGQSRSGPGVISFRVDDNWDAPRQGVVEVRWPTPTAGQNLQIAQAGCLYSVSASQINIAATGGTGQFWVYQFSDPNTCGGPLQDACLWTAVADVPWITITSSMPQRGDNPVSFTVAANDGAARTGTIRVRDKTVQISQAAR